MDLWNSWNKYRTTEKQKMITEMEKKSYTVCFHWTSLFMDMLNRGWAKIRSPTRPQHRGPTTRVAQGTRPPPRSPGCQRRRLPRAPPASPFHPPTPPPASCASLPPSLRRSSCRPPAAARGRRPWGGALVGGPVRPRTVNASPLFRFPSCRTADSQCSLLINSYHECCQTRRCYCRACCTGTE
jgi:hypothetical protein